MKQFKLQHVIIFLAAILLLGSCMGEGRNVMTTTMFGVVRFDYKRMRNVLDVGETESLYSIEFQTAQEDDCFWVYYELDYDLPENNYENSTDAEGNAIYTVTILQKESVEPGSVRTSLMDTTQVLTGEVPIIDPIIEGAFWYVKGKFFILSSLEIPNNQDMWWHFSFDYDNLMSGDGYQRVYNVYLRTNIRDKGTKTPETLTCPVVFDLKYYLQLAAQQEKSLGGTSFTIRFNYPSAISEDGNITWSYKDIQDPIQISYFIE